MDKSVTELEDKLDSFDPGQRRAALAELARLVRSGTASLPAPGERVNLHAHSFYSYNALGYSPSRIVWRGRSEGLWAVGLVDFDVLDGIDEFFQAGRLLGIKTVAGVETRAYVPEFSAREINSPGEPGIAYHMGAGLIQTAIADEGAAAFAAMMRQSARVRNMEVVTRVNAYLQPVALDYEVEVLPLSPSGTPTERHLCLAYQKKAERLFPAAADRAEFWAGRLHTPIGETQVILDDASALQALIRSKTMKAGGVGYIEPAPEAFPLMADMNRFVLSLGGIPTMAWLDGTSQGETDIEELLELQTASGVAAINIIPDRNWNVADPAVREVKLRNLHRIVELADAKGLPILVGTEMNAPGLKFVDTFDAPELQPLVPSLLRGASILVGHTIASLTDGRGYLSDWAKDQFRTIHQKNEYFHRLGRQG